MSCRIYCIINDVKITSVCAQELFEAQCFDGCDYGEYWWGVHEVMHENQLCFNVDHGEHMDWLNNDTLLNILKKHRATGKVCFIAPESSRELNAWGYRFDGQGRAVKLLGTLTFAEVYGFELELNDSVVTPSGKVGEVVGVINDEALVKLGEDECATRTYKIVDLSKLGS